MHPSRRRKKRSNYGIRTVEVNRGPNGFGFTISGQQPCILSCIVNNSPADQAGLRAGDFLISVNGVSVSKIAHDCVVNLIGSSVGPIKMTIAENYYSDSSDEELEVSRMVINRKPKFSHKPKTHRFHNKLESRKFDNITCNNSIKNALKMRECVLKRSLDDRINRNIFIKQSDNSKDISISAPIEDEAIPIEYKALVGYLGTIEMPNELLPNNRLQTVCSCIRKLRQEKRTPTAVLLTILPTCLTLKNSSNHILAIYPTSRVVYVGSATDKESRYFGIVTSATCDNRNTDNSSKYSEENSWNYQPDARKFNNADSEVDVSNSCHIFVTDPKLIDHTIHAKKAVNFNIVCTIDLITGKCLEFPKNALYIVSLIQNMYKLQSDDKNKPDEHLMPLIANSPQPSASSNSDSGIGFRDDFGNISDRILVVEFPARQIPSVKISSTFQNNEINNDVNDAEELLNNELSQNKSDFTNHFHPAASNDLSKCDLKMELKPLNNINNIRAYENVHVKSFSENSDYLKQENCLKQNNESQFHYNNFSNVDRLTCRAMLNTTIAERNITTASISSSDDNTRTADINMDNYTERIAEFNNHSKKSYECFSLVSNSEDADFKCSVDNISMHSSKSVDLDNMKTVFKMPSATFFDRKARFKMVSSCDNLDRCEDSILKYKLSPKVYGIAKPNFSYEELNNLQSLQQVGYGSLDEMYFMCGQNQNRRQIAQSEPDVRIQRSQIDTHLLRWTEGGTWPGVCIWTSFQKVQQLSSSGRLATNTKTKTIFISD